VTYVAAVAKSAREPRAAAALLAYLETPEAVRTLARFGFAPPPAKP
jgi:ABC-type molybdate transport system substrate-binding protein